MKLGIGTVQFGLDYGISNNEGKCHEQEIIAILSHANNSNIDLIDTATEYGGSETSIGKCLPLNSSFNIVTKTPTFLDLEVNPRAVRQINQSLQGSLNKLKQSSLYGLLVHNGKDLLKPGGEMIWDELTTLKKNNLVKKIGVSVYCPEETEKIIEKYPIDMIQVPLNVLDQQFIHQGTLKCLKSKGVEVHARSAFLQGLLLLDPVTLPEHFNSVKPCLSNYHNQLKSQKLTPIEGALGFINQVLEVDYLICGIQKKAHLMEIKKAFSKTCNINYHNFSVTNKKIINPSYWKT